MSKKMKTMKNWNDGRAMLSKKDFLITHFSKVFSFVSLRHSSRWGIPDTFQMLYEQDFFSFGFQMVFFFVLPYINCYSEGILMQSEFKHEVFLLTSKLFLSIFWTLLLFPREFWCSQQPKKNKLLIHCFRNVFLDSTQVFFCLNIFETRDKTFLYFFFLYVLCFIFLKSVQSTIFFQKKWVNLIFFRVKATLNSQFCFFY